MVRVLNCDQWVMCLVSSHNPTVKHDRSISEREILVICLLIQMHHIAFLGSDESWFSHFVAEKCRNLYVTFFLGVNRSFYVLLVVLLLLLFLNSECFITQELEQSKLGHSDERTIYEARTLVLVIS